MLTQVAEWLTGTYSNRTQAMAEPVWFIPVTLWYIQVPGLFGEGVGFFTEQINEHLPKEPYRSRVLQVLEHPLRLENYRLVDQTRWAGAASDVERLTTLTTEDLVHLPDCVILLTAKEEIFYGTMPNTKGCRLTPEATSYVTIEFELTEREFRTLDRGFSLTTGEQVWGSRSGFYNYQKQESR